MFLKQVLKRDVKMESAHMPDEAGLNHADAHYPEQHGSVPVQYHQFLLILNVQETHETLLIIALRHLIEHLIWQYHESAASAFGLVNDHPLRFDSH